MIPLPHGHGSYICSSSSKTMLIIPAFLLRRCLLSHSGHHAGRSSSSPSPLPRPKPSNASSDSQILSSCMAVAARPNSDIPRSGSFMHPFVMGHNSAARAGSSIPSSMIPPHPGTVARARDRVQALQAYFQQPSTSPAIRTPVSRRSSNHRGMAQVGPVAASSSDQTGAKESSDIVILDDNFASKPDNECIHWIRWPLVFLGISILLVSLTGFVGSYWNKHNLTSFSLSDGFSLSL